MLIVCTNCQSTIRVPDDAVGKKGKCPRCGTVITISAAGDAPAVPAAPASPPAETPLPSTGYASTAPPVSSEPPPLPKARARYDDFDDEPSPRYDEDDEPRRRREDEDDEDWDIRRRGPRRRAPSRGMSIAAMVLGLTGLFILLASTVVTFLFTAAAGPGGCCVGIIGGPIALLVAGVLGLLGIILGFVGLSHGGRGFAWTGIGTGSASVLLVLLFLLLSFLGFVALVGIGVAAQQQQMQQQNNFRAPPNFNPPPRINPRKF